MAAAGTTSEGTEAQAPTGFPPFKTETYPAQLFWLAITFGFLFVVLWRAAGPRISSVLAERKGRIDGDLSDAETHRKGAEAALATYQSALAAARQTAQGMADDNRKRVAAEVASAKELAEAQARAAAGIAQARIAATREEAKTHVAKAAAEAAIDIVARLTGDNVSPADAAAAVRTASGN